MRLRRLMRRLRSLFARRAVERELEDELRVHLELDAAERLRRGSSPEDARREAAVAFGGYDAVSEACRDVRGVGRLEELGRAVRYAARSLRRSPAFTLTATSVLALGIGAVTAVFSIAEGVLLRPLPYDSPERLYAVYEANEQGALRGASYPTVRDWQSGVGEAVTLAYVRGEQLSARFDEGTALLLAGYASERFFDVMGGDPALGRVWDAEEAYAGARVAVLSHETWRRFGGDAAIVGRSIPTDSGPLTVIGVAPRGFRTPAWADLWLPLQSLPAASRYVLERRDLHVDSRVIARVPAGGSADAATAALGLVNRRLAEDHAEARAWPAVRMVVLRDELLGAAPTRIAILAAAVAALLLISCVNVGGLLIARGAARGRELATRRALGASRRRVLSQLLVEAGVLATLGALLGSALAWVTIRTIVAAAPAALPRLEGVTMDAKALAFAIVTGAATALLVGTLPALRSAGITPMELLRGGRSAIGGRRADRLRAALVVTEVALATVLVVGAVLLFRTVAALGRVELGVDPDGIAAVQIVPPSPRYDDAEAARALYRRLQEAAAAVPGVHGAALINHLPLTGGSMPTPVRTGRELAADERPLAMYRSVSVDYFATLGIDIVRGRSFTPQEAGGRAPVAIVNEALSRREWGEADPLGRTIVVRRSAQDRSDFGEELVLTVIGVATDTHDFGPAVPAPAAVYVSIPHAVWSHMYVVVKAEAGRLDRVIPELGRALLAVDPSLPLAGPAFMHRIQPLARYAGRAIGEQRLNAAVLTSFAAVAFALAAVGVFGIIAYQVIERRREFGLRMTLGARPGDVVRMVVTGGVKLVVAGCALGLLAAAFATRLLRSLLFGVTPGDVRSFAAAAALFLLAGILASAIPALRAARTEPGRILRTE